ncbi:MAG: OmpH family outer membrane protein [Candidatus Kapaibacterium sp.]
MAPTKRLIPRLGVLLTLFCAAVTAQAQTKIGFVASEAILDKLPDAKNARAKLTDLQSGWMREIQRQEQDIDRARTEMQANRLLWSAQEKRDAESRLADLEMKLNSFRNSKFGPKQEFERQQSDLMGPVMEKIAKAIEDEAKAQKYDYVFDKSSRGMPMLFANPANDITWQVLKRLGVDASDTASTAAAANPETDAKAEADARNKRMRREFRPEPIDPNKVLQPSNGGTSAVPPKGTETESTEPK